MRQRFPGQRPERHARSQRPQRHRRNVGLIDGSIINSSATPATLTGSDLRRPQRHDRRPARQQRRSDDQGHARHGHPRPTMPGIPSSTAAEPTSRAASSSSITPAAPARPRPFSPLSTPAMTKAHKFASGPLRSSNADGTYGLGWADDTTSHQVTVARAAYGDVTLDGTVDFSDLGYRHRQLRDDRADWADGDCNYDGAVDFSRPGLSSSATTANPRPTCRRKSSPSPGSAPPKPAADSVQFVVVFSKPVTGVDASDFQLHCSGTSGTIASVDPCSSSGIGYLVTVDNVLGHGTLGLNLIDDDSILDANHVAAGRRRNRRRLLHRRGLHHDRAVRLGRRRQRRQLVHGRQLGRRRPAAGRQRPLLHRHAVGKWMY